jgi:hypothetical protein
MPNTYGADAAGVYEIISCTHWIRPGPQQAEHMRKTSAKDVLTCRTADMSTLSLVVYLWVRERQSRGRRKVQLRGRGMVNLW